MATGWHTCVFAFARTCQLPATSMSPHVLVQAEKHEEENLQASFFFCFICLTFFFVVSLLVNYLETYKRRLVKFLLIPFEALQEEEDEEGDGEQQLFRHLTQQHLHQFDCSHQLEHGHCNYDNPFGMSAPKYAMEDRDVLYHAQVTLGCNGLRDLYNLGYMRQDTLERRIKAAGKRINLNSTVSLCAVWLREKIGRTFSTTSMGTRPEIKDLCLFLERRGCSRDMCCQTFYDAFQRVNKSHASQVSLRVGNVVLTSFRAIVDHIYDHWYQWLDEPETPAGVVDLEAAQQNNDDGKLPPYPAYNHDLAVLSPAELNLRLETSLEQLHQGHDHHSRRDNDDAKRGAQKREHPGYCAPFDLGQASSWGSESNQSDRCATRLQDCACKHCSIIGWLSHLAGFPILTADDIDYPGQDKNCTGVYDKMVMNPQRAAFLASTSVAAAENHPFGNIAQQPQDHDGRNSKEGMDADCVISCDLIRFENNSGGMEEVDHFLADVDVLPEGETQDLGIAPQTQGEARKKQKLDEACTMEPSLLDSSLEMGSGQGIMTDISFGVDNKSIHEDPSYSPFVQELFRNRENLWVQKAKRPTALDMWDAADGTTLKDDAV
ncbi:hypothetical protein CFAM422_007888 [Trichoderma lentiforme]|uniref:Uncharacterized protein n=1 Tax=Trichoderma lentiforme TaxID=1567552 RepID=A0A9P4XD21_9HYPO|nr:hypothetical protein CFAM422_007888 [Trichoderma lentiforme]